MAIKKFGISLIFATILLVGVMFVSVVSAQENANKELTFGPETLEKLKSDPNFIAVYGSIPAFGSSEEREQWIDTLDEIYSGSNSEMSEYMYPNGVVTSYGYTIDGVIEVGAINKTVEKPLMDEIYQILDSKASRIGIKEVPVVFVHRDLAVPLVEPAVKETTNLSASEEKNAVELSNSNDNNSELNNGTSLNINNSSGDKSSENNSAPGFGSLGGLLYLYGGWRLSKK